MLNIPTGLKPLVDGDVLRYEVGFGAETGWRAMHPDIPKEEECLPPFQYVADMLDQRLKSIQTACNTSEQPQLYFTSGPTFRFDIAKKKPYKGQRKEHKPWHYNNLTAFIKYELGAIEVTGIEADDQLAIDHVASNGSTIVCSRDKDLRQLPGWSYSWELGRQPSFGPELITKEGWLKLSPKRDKIVGTGLAFFYSQVLTGDTADNIPGLPNTGPVAAFELLQGRTPAEQLRAVNKAYFDYYGKQEDPQWADTHWPLWEREVTEQGRLCWLVRRLNEDGTPQLWEIGLEE